MFLPRGAVVSGGGCCCRVGFGRWSSLPKFACGKCEGALSLVGVGGHLDAKPSLPLRQWCEPPHSDLLDITTPIMQRQVLITHQTCRALLHRRARKMLAGFNRA